MRKVHFLMKCSFILMKCKNTMFLTLSSPLNLGFWNQLGPPPPVLSPGADTEAGCLGKSVTWAL